MGDRAAVEWVAVEQLRPWAGNPRDNAAAVPMVKASIERFGFGAPLVVNEGGEIIAGHTRWLAARELGLRRVPVRWLELSEVEAHALCIADNKLGEVAEWDAGAMEREARLLGELLAGLGFDDVSALPAGLPDAGGGDVGPSVVQVTYHFKDAAQLMVVERALAAAKSRGPYGATGNGHGPGNALARMCEGFGG